MLFFLSCRDLAKVQEKCIELMDSGVTEKDITKCILDGSDPYNLAQELISKSVYKCGFQCLRMKSEVM